MVSILTTFLSFMFVNPVTVTSVTPNEATSGISSFTIIKGYDFVRTQLMKCSFGSGIQIDAVFVASTVFNCALPPNMMGECCVAISLNAFQFRHHVLACLWCRCPLF